VPIEQNRLKRAGLGLRGWDRERACPGYTLFTPLNAGQTAYLIDLSGEVIHRWELPYPPGLYGALTPRGTLYYNGKIVEQSDRFIATQPWKGGAALELDWAGRVLWEVRQRDHHHDSTLLRNGNVLFLCLTALPAEIAARVQGGQPGSEHEGLMYADYLVEMSRSGETVWEWRCWDHLDPAAFPLVAPGERRTEWTHGNTVVEMVDGDIMLSFRHISTVAIFDRARGNLVWKLGPPPLSHQHAPTSLPNGNLLIFDNGTHRRDHATPYSRVLEIDPTTDEIVWSYQDRPLANFFSPYISNAQRLPNGNTLICEGSFGRIFEVTPGGEVVWEYINPHFAPPAGKPDDPPLNTVFRAFRYSEEAIDRARATIELPASG
jgi:arylsulfotransferase ASST